MRSLLVIALLLIQASNAGAADVVTHRQWLGKARLFTNDFIGDGKDRWRTGSYAISAIRGQAWDGTLPSTFGELVEYRIRSEIIAPANLQNPVLGTDRPYVGALSFGAFSHMQAGAGDLSLGLEMVFTGPQTGLGGFQDGVHRAIGMRPIKVLGSQLGNAVYPTLNLELAHGFELTGKAHRRIAFRPFVEAQAGVETYLRIGADLTFGPAGQGDFQVRDATTGQRVVAMKSTRARGVSFLLGADAAYVASSRYLPASSGYVVTSPRLRLRAGIYNEGKAGSFFYGLTWLGKEFSNQRASQVVGSVTIRLDF